MLAFVIYILSVIIFHMITMKTSSQSDLRWESTCPYIVYLLCICQSLADKKLKSQPCNQINHLLKHDFLYLNQQQNKQCSCVTVIENRVLKCSGPFCINLLTYLLYLQTLLIEHPDKHPGNKKQSVYLGGGALRKMG